MDENVKKIGAGVLGLIALVMVIKALFFSGGSKYDIESTDPVERMAAVEDFRRDDSVSAREVLIRVAESDKDLGVKISTIHAMRVNQDEDTERTLRRMAQSESSPRVRGEALAALGSYKKVSTNELTAVLGSGAKSPEERMGAAKGLANRADRKSIPALFAALRDPDEKVRAWAITGIKQITYVGFLYDARKPPHEQNEVIGQISAYLSRNGFK